MSKWFKYPLYLFVLIGYSFVHAGSYEDFFTAIRYDDARVVRSFLQRGFDPNTLNPNGVVGLMLAIVEPSPNVVDALLESPTTRVEWRNSADESPLMMAALKGYAKVCEQLIARDADVNKPGWTALHYAATGGHGDIVQLLLREHAYIDAASPNGSTPLMMAAKYGGSGVVQVLLDAGADPLIKNNLGLTALDFARDASKEASGAAIAVAVRQRGISRNPK